MARVFFLSQLPPKVMFGSIGQQTWPKDIPKFQPEGEIQGQAALDLTAVSAGQMLGYVQDA